MTDDTRDASIWTALAGAEFSLSRVQVGKWSTRVLQAGPADGPALILAPGTGGHLEAYARNVAFLAGQGFRVVAYDYPGHGYTTHADADLEIPDYVEHLDGLLDALGIARAHLSGESLGGWVAVKYAVAHPERVLRMVLNTPGGAISRAETMETIRRLSQAAADDPSPANVRTRLEWLMADNASVTDELVAMRRQIYARPGFSDSMRHILCLQDLEVRTRNAITDDELKGIGHPTLVVWTSDDPSGPAATGMHMAEVLPNGTFELIADAGHWPQWEQPDRFNELAAGFLSKS
jgi:2-hydroxy-6-oxonona-2,4-dienedioate hydrolase